MAEYQELLDVIAAVRRQSGDQNAWMRDLSTTDLAVATNPMLSSPDRIALVINRIRSGNPDVFQPHLGDGGAGGGSAADAIRLAEAALARQNSRTAAVDLQVISAILNAHSVNSEGQRKLSGIQQEIEHAVTSRTDLGTPAGAQDFQRYLLGKLREMQTVVDAVGVDATSKATLSAALASLYAADTGREDSGRGSRVVGDDWPGDELFDPLQWPITAAPTTGSPMTGQPTTGPPTPMPPGPASGPTPLPPPPLTSPPPASSMPFGSGLPSLGGAALPSAGLPLLAPLESRPDLPESESVASELVGPELDQSEIDGSESADADDADAPPDEQIHVDDPNTVVLPDGETVTAESPAIAKAITAAVHGLPIAEAFRQQGITIPAPGSPVPQPIDPAQLEPGDVGVFADRHALAVGGGKALLNNQIQPVEELPESGFLGWQHALAPAEPADEPALTMPELTTAAPSG